MFAPIRPGEALLNLDVQASVQSDRLIQDTYSAPLVLDYGIWFVPLTLLQSEYGDDYVKAFAGEPPTGGSITRFTGVTTVNFRTWKTLEQDLVFSIARTYFSRQALETPTIPSDDIAPASAPLGREFLPSAAGEYSVPITTTVTDLSHVLEPTVALAAERMEQTTFLEALARYDVKPSDYPNIPETILWERRVLQAREELLPTGGGPQTASTEPPAPPARTLSTDQETTGGYNYLTSAVPAVSLGTAIREKRNKTLKWTTPGFIVGAYVVREGTYRPGFYSGQRRPGGRGLSHASAMTLANDWCPPGTGFNDAFRLLGNTDGNDMFDSTKGSAFSFDPMLYFFYGETYVALVQDGIRDDRYNTYFDATGKEIDPAATASDRWSFINKGLAELTIHTDLID